MSSAYIFIRTAVEGIPHLDDLRKAMIKHVRDQRYEYEGIMTVSANPYDSIQGFMELADTGELDGIAVIFSCIIGKGRTKVMRDMRRYLSQKGLAARLFLINPEVLT